MNSFQSRFLFYFAAATLLTLFIIVWFMINSLGLINVIMISLLAGTIFGVWATLGDVETNSAHSDQSDETTQPTVSISH